MVFESAAGNLTDTPFPSGVFHVFLRDREKGTTRLLTTNANGEPANGSSGNPVISADGTAVAFESVATDLIAAHESTRSTVGIYLDSALLRCADAAGRDEHRPSLRRPERVSGDQRRRQIQRLRVEGGPDLCTGVGVCD